MLLEQPQEPGQDYCPHFTEENTEAQGSYLISL